MDIPAQTDESEDRSKPLTPERAAEILLMRRNARKNYRDFLKYWIDVTRAPFLWNWHMDYLSDVMQGVTERAEDCRFLIINIPPRFMKSTLVSQMWQAWMIGFENSRRSSLLSVASTGILAARDSRRTMQALSEPWYNAVFPDVKFGSKQTEAEWETTCGAYRIAAGAGGTITGRGADHITSDDPLKADEANSEGIREGVNEWLGETMRNRLDDQKTGTITHIMQRLHERDVTGYLRGEMRKAGADQYRLIDLPNEAIGKTVISFRNTVYKVREDKELLHPDRIGAKETIALKVAMRHNYSGQYQQRPTKMEGGHLNPARLVALKGTALELKSSLGLSTYFFLDFAQSEKQTQKDDPDYNVIGVFARDQYQRLIILDLWRKQTADQSIVARQFINMHRLWRPVRSKGEKGGILNTLGPVLAQQRKLANYPYAHLEPTKSRTHDKVTRSEPFKAMCDSGMVCYPEGAPFVEDFLAEMRSFPSGAHDDLTDPCFDAAIEFPDMRVGDAPMRDPDNPVIIANESVQKRILARVEQIKNGDKPKADYIDAGW